MSGEHEGGPTPEEMGIAPDPKNIPEMAASRTLSDAELWKQGGEYSENAVLDPTAEQKDNAKVEMDADLLKKIFSDQEIKLIREAVLDYTAGMEQRIRESGRGNPNYEIGVEIEERLDQILKTLSKK